MTISSSVSIFITLAKFSNKAYKFKVKRTSLFHALLERRGRAAAPPEAGAAAPAPAPPDSPLPIFPSPQPQTSERHPRSISVTKKTSAADATCFSVLPCGRASTLGLASAMPETATRAKPAVEKSLEERVAGAAALAAVELLMFFFFGEEAEEGWKEREKQGREGRRRRRRRRRRRQIRTLPTHPKPDAFRLIECIFAFDSNAAR